ncbi:MAG: hypothetical protein ACAI35_25610 [Candidatus Methylacidiphilales bacterium]|nr:hypothetical protein [Candidatus Methylacidiphilales bacterium]
MTFSLKHFRASLSLLLGIAFCAGMIGGIATQAHAQSRPAAETILQPPPKVPVPPQGEVPTGAPAQLPAARTGKGTVFFGHRFYGEKEAGWGWVRSASDSWANAKWCALKETPGVIMAPFRTLPNRWDDHNHEYKFWGRWADYTAYDPHRDEDLPVFIIEGYESLGPQKDLKRTPGAVRRNRPSRGATSR